MFFRHNHESTTLQIVTAAIGSDYFRSWKANSFPTWELFASRHGYGIHCLTQQLSVGSSHLGWNKFLALEKVFEQVDESVTVLLLDADQVISPLAPEVPTSSLDGSLGVIPEDPLSERKILSFVRRSFLDPNFPLDSLAVFEPSDFAKLAGREHFARFKFYSSGFVVIPPESRSKVLDFVQNASPTEFKDLDDEGDQYAFIEFVNGSDYVELSREWQGIWPNILARDYPFLYKNRDRNLAKEAIAAAMLRFHIIHFSTSLPEKDFWELDALAGWSTLFENCGGVDLEEYMSRSLDPKAYGRLKLSSQRFFH